jgi:hypothetical protein
VATNLDWPLCQFDVKNVFLHGNREEVYMKVSLGLEYSSSKGIVCKLKKAFYGLKQSPRVWFERFSRFMQRFDYKQSEVDHTLFIEHFSQGKAMTLIVYVDGIVVPRDDDEEIQSLKKSLANDF